MKLYMSFIKTLFVIYDCTFNAHILCARLLVVLQHQKRQQVSYRYHTGICMKTKQWYTRQRYHQLIYKQVTNNMYPASSRGNSIKYIYFIIKIAILYNNCHIYGRYFLSLK